MSSIFHPEHATLPQEQLHPTDEPAEVGSHNTLGFLHERTMNYLEKKHVLEEEINAQKLQEQKVIAAQLDFTLAKSSLTEAIKGASKVTKDAENSKHSLATSAPPVEIPPLVLPGEEWSDGIGDQPRDVPGWEKIF